jgi:AraC-like DNA-binding protein
VGSTTSILGTGSLFTYEPRQAVNLRSCSPHPLIKCFVDFSGTELPTLLAPLHAHPGHRVDLSPLPWIGSNFRQLIELGKSQQIEPCLHLLRLLLAQVPPLRALRKPSRNAGYRLYQRCRDCIERDFASLRSLRDLAQALHVSEAYLCRTFQHHHGESPARALTRRKMEAAAERLFQGTELVKTVAAEVGYEDPFHFSRVFKQHYGVAPVHFCKRHRSPATP